MAAFSHGWLNIHGNDMDASSTKARRNCTQIWKILLSIMKFIQAFINKK